MFRVIVKFTGICSFVPRDITGGQKLAYCVVLPNAWYDERRRICADPNKKGVDGLSDLRPHRAFMRFDASRVKGAPAIFDDITGVRFLESERILFVPTASTTPDFKEGDIRGLATSGDITSTTPTNLLSIANAVNTPTYCGVAAQILIENGELSAPYGALKWTFDNYLLSGPPKDKKLCHEVKLDFGAIDSLKLQVRDLFNNSVKRELFFDSADNSNPLEITVANLCLHDPLQWEPASHRNNPVDDEDFRWHYEVVDDPVALQAALNGLRAPIPRATGLPNGNGFNCFPKQFAAVDFDPAAWH